MFKAGDLVESNLSWDNTFGELQILRGAIVVSVKEDIVTVKNNRDKIQQWHYTYLTHTRDHYLNQFEQCLKQAT